MSARSAVLTALILRRSVSGAQPIPTATTTTATRLPSPPRFLTAAALAMPPKRKRAEDHPAREDAPRRSSRRVKEPPTVVKASSVSKTGLLDDSSPKARRAVERAMLELSEMEHKLQDDTRRQRLAIQSSSFRVDAEDATRVAFQTYSSVPAEEMVPDTALGKANGTNSDDEIGNDRDSEYVISNKDEGGDVAAERGAKRPPPVNSEKLPLPWSGRLGYVRSLYRSTAVSANTRCSAANVQAGVPKHLFEIREPTGILL